MKVLFLDQSGKLGGAELSLLDVASAFPNCLVGLLQDGPFRAALESQGTPVQVLATAPLQVRKDSSFAQSLQSLGQLVPLILKTGRMAQAFDVIYTNTSKALVVGTFASQLYQRPLVHHLRDILSADHFSRANQRLMVELLNRFSSLIVCNSTATKAAFVAAGGQADKAVVVYNGFRPDTYQVPDIERNRLRQTLGLDHKFVVGHFSRLSPWKGQDVLLQALQHCPDNVVALLVGDALFGENAYVEQLHQIVRDLNLQHRVHFLGFRTDVPALMTVCDLIAHTSTAAEPFGRVIVEAMLCQRPIIAAAEGGAAELVEHGKTGWLCPPGQPQKLAELLTTCCQNPDANSVIAQTAYRYAHEAFHLKTTNQKLMELLTAALSKNP